MEANPETHGHRSCPDHARGPAGAGAGDRAGSWFADSPAGPLLVAGGVMCGCAALAVADPTTPGGPTPVCPTKALLGIPCPVCGTARMVYSLTHLDITGAIRYNAVTLVLALLLVWWWVVWLGRTLGTRLPNPFAWRPMPKVIIGVLVVWGIIRLLPFEPFTALRV